MLSPITNPSSARAGNRGDGGHDEDCQGGRN